MRPLFFLVLCLFFNGRFYARRNAPGVFYGRAPPPKIFIDVGDSKDLLSRLRTAVIGPIINFLFVIGGTRSEF